MREGYLPVAGTELFFREIGEGAPVVVLHGGPDFDHSYLLPELDALSSGLRLIYYDQRGRGRSSNAVVPGDVGIESEVADLDEVRRSFGLGAMTILAHSWGCVLALEYATRHEHNVRGLVLMNTAPTSHADLLRLRAHREAAEAGTLARMRAIAATREYADGDIATEKAYYRLHFGATLRSPDRLHRIVDSLRKHFTAQGIVKARAIEDRLYAETWQVPDYDLLARVRELRVPALVIHGDRDLIPVECAEHVAAAIPGAHLLVLNDCGHFSYVDRPDEVFRAIVDFVAEC